MPPIRRYPLVAFCLVLFSLSPSSRSLAAVDLNWDLSYESSLMVYPIADNEFMRIWVKRYPKRLIHEKLTEYTGQHIQASLLIERPDGHAGDPQALWFIKTATTAQACAFHPKIMNEPCQSLDPSRTEEFIREVMRFEAMPIRPFGQNSIGEDERDGTPILINYVGFLSIFVEGAVLQRPIALTEMAEAGAQPESNPDAGRLQRAIARLMLSDAEFKKDQANLEAQAKQRELENAVRYGDLQTMSRLLPQKQAFDPLTAIASRNGQKLAVDFLLAHGANIDANESAALKSAVEADDADMIEYLLAKGAKVDPPLDSRNPNRRIYESALGAAVRLHNEKLVRLLLRRGADVNLNESIFLRAAHSLDLPMVDLLLSNGAKPGTAVSSLMVYSGKLGGWPQNEEEQKDILRREAEIEKVVRRLVAAGANLNDLSPICGTAYSEATLRRSEGMMKLLRELGADSSRSRICDERIKQGSLGSTQGTEAKAREAVAAETNRYFNLADYKSLEKLYKRLLTKKERTPSGIWKLAVFYHELQALPKRKREPQYQALLRKQAQDWQKAIPQSVAARIFAAYVQWSRETSERCRADCSKSSSAEDVKKGATEALATLNDIKPLARRGKDPEWYRAMVSVLPYTNSFTPSRLSAMADEGMRLYPDYHELYFWTAFYSQEKWNGARDAVDLIVKKGTEALKTTERKSLYARIYWFMDQAEYHGRIFDVSGANWNEMKGSFTDIIATYPDPSNMNAYAYFACLAKDYSTARRLLEQIGSELVFKSWGKEAVKTYIDCINNSHVEMGDVWKG